MLFKMSNIALSILAVLLLSVVSIHGHGSAHDYRYNCPKNITEPEALRGPRRGPPRGPPPSVTVSLPPGILPVSQITYRAGGPRGRFAYAGRFLTQAQLVQGVRYRYFPGVGYLPLQSGVPLYQNYWDSCNQMCCTNPQACQPGMNICSDICINCLSSEFGCPAFCQCVNPAPMSQIIVAPVKEGANQTASILAARERRKERPEKSEKSVSIDLPRGTLTSSHFSIHVGGPKGRFAAPGRFLRRNQLLQGVRYRYFPNLGYVQIQSGVNLYQNYWSSCNQICCANPDMCQPGMNICSDICINCLSSEYGCPEFCQCVNPVPISRIVMVPIRQAPLAERENQTLPLMNQTVTAPLSASCP